MNILLDAMVIVGLAILTTLLIVIPPGVVLICMGYTGGGGY